MVNPPEGYETKPLDDFDEPISLGPGDELEGALIEVKKGENENGPWALLTVADRERGRVQYFAKGAAKQAAIEGSIGPGDEIWIGVDEDEQTFTADDGMEQPYHEHHFAVKE